ncbi:MAG: lytic murein transglycosylase B [Gallionella sp.]
MKFNYHIFALAVSFAGPSASAVTLPGIPEFIDEMVVRHHFNRVELEMVFDNAQHLPAVIEAILRPATSKPWLEYRAAFVNPQRVRYGLEFWKKYLKTLRRAEKEFNVPQEIIIALIGVETIYGINKGTFRTLDALTTLAFDFPRRKEFFRSELENYLLLARDQQLDLNTILGSYAGALGIPQFMPSSYRSYAVDFNGNQKVDLLNEPADAIGSVANYLKNYGWINSTPIAVRAKVAEKAWVGEITAQRPIAAWKAVGIVPQKILPQDQPARLLDFTVAEGKELWLVLNDFEVITRYNNSDFYAMTVFQLAEELKAARKTKAAR